MWIVSLSESPISLSELPALTLDFPKLPEMLPVVLNLGLIFERFDSEKEGSDIK